MIVTSTAQTLVGAGTADVYAAIVALARDLWQMCDDDIVETAAPQRLVHGVRLDGDVACWLSWELTSVGPRSTRVQVRHDELTTTSVPPPTLDELLERLRAALPAHH